MSKITAKRNTFIVGATFVVLALINLFPLHYSKQQACPHGGSYTESGRFMGLPFAYFRTAHGGIGDCPGMVGDSPSNQFSAQALLGDGLVFGLVMMGVNMLVDTRRARA